MTGAKARGRPALVYLEDYRYCYEYLPDSREYRKILIVDRNRPAKKTDVDPVRYFDEIHVIDTEDSDDVDALVDRLSTCRVHRILASTETTVKLGGLLRERLSVPGLTATQSHRFRDKHSMKAFLRSHGVPTARFAPCDSLESVIGFASRVGYPVVVKPAEGYGTSRTWKIEKAEELEELWARSDLTGYLVEEFISGREFHLDSIVVGGEVVFTSVGEYIVPLLESIRHNLIDGSIVYPDDAASAFPFMEKLKKLQRDVLSLLDHRNGVAHGEYFMRQDGSILFSEIAPRIGGSTVISDSIEHTHGVNMFRAFVRAELGLPVERAPVPSPVFTANICFPTTAGVVDKVTTVDELVREPGVVHAAVFVKEGDRLTKRESSMVRAGYAILSDRDLERLGEHVRNVHERFQICTLPL